MVGGWIKRRRCSFQWNIGRSQISRSDDIIFDFWVADVDESIIFAYVVEVLGLGYRFTCITAVKAVTILAALFIKEMRTILE